MTSQARERVLGLVGPGDSDEAEMCKEHRKFLPDWVSPVYSHTSGCAEVTTLKYFSAKAENPEIEEAAFRLLKFRPDCIAFNDTSISFARGVGYDQEISDRITARTSVAATTTSTAMVRALRHMGIRRVAAAAPYLSDVNEAFVRFLEESGFSVVKMVGLGLGTEAIVNLPHNEISKLARSANVKEAQAVFISCTALRTADILEKLEKDLGKPVLTAIQVTMWDALRIMGVRDFPGGIGRLFTHARM